MGKKYFAFVVILFLAIECHSQTGFYPDTHMGAQLYSMGRSASISLYEVMGVTLNPASINNSHRSMGSLNYMYLDRDTKNISAGIILSTSDYGNFGLSYYRFSSEFAITESTPFPIGTGTWLKSYFLISYGNSISKTVNFGLNGKLMETDLSGNNNTYSEQGMALDMGINYQPVLESRFLENLKFSIAAQNLFSNYGDGITLNRDIRFIFENMVSFGKIEMTGLFNLRYYENYSSEWDTDINLGFDITYAYFSGRIGYSSIADFLSSGAGVNYQDISINYGYGYFYDSIMDTRHTVSLNLFFN